MMENEKILEDKDPFYNGEFADVLCACDRVREIIATASQVNSESAKKICLQEQRKFLQIALKQLT